MSTSTKITDSADDKLVDCILRKDDHTLHELLSKRDDIANRYIANTYERTIPEKKGHLVEKNFITRMLYKMRTVIFKFLTDLGLPFHFDSLLGPIHE